MKKKLAAIFLASAAVAAPLAVASGTGSHHSHGSQRAGSKPGIASGANGAVLAGSKLGIASGSNALFVGSKPGIAGGQN